MVEHINLEDDMRNNILRQIHIERESQITEHAYSATRDNEYTEGELAEAAATYAWLAGKSKIKKLGMKMFKKLWPVNWETKHYNPKSAREDLVRAGALIVAEIERLDRLKLETMAKSAAPQRAILVEEKDAFATPPAHVVDAQVVKTLEQIEALNEQLRVVNSLGVTIDYNVDTNEGSLLRIDATIYTLHGKTR